MVDDIWIEVRRYARTALSEQSFAAWITPLRAIAWDERELTIEAPSAFCRDWVRRHHLGVLVEGVTRAAGRPATVKLVVNAALVPPSPPSSAEPADSHRPVAKPARTARVEAERYTFETFVVGTSNAVAYRAARAVVERPGARYNPLFLYGGVGLGKTHLLWAIAHGLGGGGRVVCISAETFVNEMIEALRRDQMEQFRRRFRHIGTLVVDDVQFLAGKVRSQQEFTNTFNALHGGRRQIVLASDKPPHELPGLEDALRSRFASGLLADIQRPDPELRVALAGAKAAALGMVLSGDVAQHLARHWCENVRQLEGALARIDAFASLTGREVTAGLVREALAPYAAQRGRVTIERILGEVCLEFRVTRDELTSGRRTARVALPRQVAMYLCRRHTDVPLKTIGAGLGGRDHSTVVHGFGVIEQRLRADDALRERVAVLEARLAS